MSEVGILGRNQSLGIALACSWVGTWHMWQRRVLSEEFSWFYARALGHVTDDFLRNVAFCNQEPLCCNHYVASAEEESLFKVSCLLIFPHALKCVQTLMHQPPRRKENRRLKTRRRVAARRRGTNELTCSNPLSTSLCHTA